MSYLYNLPNRNEGRVQIFYNNGTWIKPEGICMVSIFMFGGGGGGGGGATGGAGTTRVGGGGGGSGAISRALFPAFALPSTLNVVVSPGGAGGIAGGSGVSATLTYVDLPNSGNNFSTAPTISSTILIRATGGASGTGAGGGGGGGGAAAATTFAGTTISITALSPGQQGGSSATKDVVFGGTVFDTISGGAGGGSTTLATPTAGGSITVTPTSYMPANPGGGNTGVRGNDGVFLFKPLSSTGGSGGGAIDNGTGGRGGDAAIGSGGGGGGAGTTGGAGGRGGNGLVIITCW